MTVVGVLSACGAPRIDDSDACGCGFYTADKSKNPIHWTDGTTVHYVVHKDFPKELRSSLHSIESAYNTVLEKTKLDVDTKSDSAPGYTDQNVQSVSNDGTNGIYWVSEPWPWEKSNPGTDAMTIVISNGTSILETDIFFRAQSYQNTDKAAARLSELSAETITPTEVKTASQDARWVYVIGLHEFGHSLGRVHATDPTSIMYKSTGLNFVKSPFSNYDLKTFEEVYSLKQDYVVK